MEHSCSNGSGSLGCEPCLKELMAELEVMTKHANEGWALANTRTAELTSANLQVGAMRKALDHATTCPLIKKARSIMGDSPEKITACLGCRDALLLLGTDLKRVDEVHVCDFCGWRNDGSRVMYTVGKVTKCGNCMPIGR